jgi:hypothetical protein
MLVIGMARASSWAKTPLALLWAAPWLLMQLLLAIALVGLAASTMLRPLAYLWPSFAPYGEAILQVEDHFRRGPLDQAIKDSVGFLLFVIVAVGVIILAIMASMLFVGMIRIGIFSVIGVMDQIDSQDSLVNAALGTISISIVPDGPSETLLLSGRALFNQVKIYDDERTIARIAKYVHDAHLAELATRTLIVPHTSFAAKALETTSRTSIKPGDSFPDPGTGHPVLARFCPFQPAPSALASLGSR